MKITIRLEPDVETRLTAQARVQDLSLKAYIRTVLEQAAGMESRPAISIAEFEAALDALADGSEQLPVLPPKAYRRESIYGSA